MIPKNLIEQIKSKNVILFLGSGASIGSTTAEGNKIPSTQELADKIANKYLGDKYLGKALNYVSELAINESSLFDFQSFIHDIFFPFNPADFHKKIPLFPWNNIFTTNYDLIVERAYQENKNRVQEIFPLSRNTSQVQIPKGEKILQYLKLHGCINHIGEEDCPLIFTPDQYVTHKNNRERLFSRFQELSADYPILFVGHSLSDLDIRYYLQLLESLKAAKPMSYLVAPGLTPEEERLWSAKRITCIKLTFSDFLAELEKEIDVNQRKLASFKIKSELPIFEKFIVDVNAVNPTENLIAFINNDIDFINRDIVSPNTDPKSFYKGYFESWDPIIKNLDVKRSISDAVLYEVFLEEQEHISVEFYFYLIKGNAGSGKSVLLKRIAFEAANELSRFCIMYKPYVKPSFDELLELYSFVKERIYVFIDNVSNSKNDLISLFDKIRRNKLPVTFIGCERINIWNTECKEIHPYLSEDYHVKYLNDKEITELLILLEKHNSLGALEFKSEDERVISLRETAGRELLVALYEATNSKPFEEIIYDEYKRINNPTAQSLYLTVSVLHRLGAEARAGLISRVHGISFHEFKEKLFEPLEYIVFDRKNPRLNDFVYLTRHKQVAEMIFTTVLKTPQERFDEYVRIITHLNIDFESDKIAFFAMTNGRQLANLFPDPLMARNFYDIAIENNPNEKMLFQHRAIYEMTVPGGNLVLAERYLNEAKVPGEINPIVDHSLAELTYRKAERAKYDNEFYAHIEEVLSLCKSLIAKFPNQIHAYHTILKAINLKLEKIFDKNDAPSIERTLRESEKYFQLANQYYPNNSYILEAESRLNELINKESNALTILEKAYETHKASPFICLRYSNLLENDGQINKAIAVMKEALNLTPHDKDLNFKLAELLSKYFKGTIEEILHYLRRSFTKGDSRFNAQFWYARALYLNNQFSESKEIFTEIEKARLDPSIKKAARGMIKENNIPVIFEGEVFKLFFNYGFIKRNKFGDTIFFNTQDFEDGKLTNGQPIVCNIAFNFKGPIATNIKLK